MTEAERIKQLEGLLSWREMQLTNTGRHLDRCRDALEMLASLEEGEAVCGSFDAPWFAKKAREVMGELWIGPCFHGRDPWTRCDTCEDLGADVAWAKARRAELGLGCGHEFRRDEESNGMACVWCGYWRYCDE